MANLRENQIPALVIHTPADTSYSQATVQTQQSPHEEVRLTDEQEVVSVTANVDVTFPEATDGFDEETSEDIAQDNETESTRTNQIAIADRVTDVYQSSVYSGPSSDTNTGPLQTEPTADNQVEGSVSSGSLLSTSSQASWAEPVVNVLNWMDHALSRRPPGVTSPSWQHGYRAGIRATMETLSEQGVITEHMGLDLLPEPLFSNSPPALHQHRRTESVRAHVDVVRRETSQEHRANSNTVPELDTNAAETSASATPTRATLPFVVLTTTPGRPRVTSILSGGSPSGSVLAEPTVSMSPRIGLDPPTHTRESSDRSPPGLLNMPVTARRPNQHVRYPSAPLLATNENVDARPSRLSMMEYAKATEDVNDMKRFGDEAEADEVVPGGLVRGSPVGGYPKRRSSVLRRVNVGRRERESALYSSGLTQAVEEENSERITEMLEDLGTGAERRGGSVMKLLKKGKKRLSTLFN